MILVSEILSFAAGKEGLRQAAQEGLPTRRATFEIVAGVGLNLFSSDEFFGVEGGVQATLQQEDCIYYEEEDFQSFYPGSKFFFKNFSWFWILSKI